MKELVRKIVCIILVANMLLVSGCAGRQANPVQVSQFNDSQMSCNHLKAEISRIRYEIQNKTGQKAEGDLKDTALFAAGMVVFWPALFFMDLKNADKVELEALRNRYNYLINVYNNKNCP